MSVWKDRGLGLFLCLCIALPCWLLGKAVPVVGGPVFAILAGMVIALFYREKRRTQAGIAFTSKKILQYAVILLGFGIVQIGLALKGHDASQRAQGFMTFFGGVVIYFAKDILDMIL